MGRRLRGFEEVKDAQADFSVIPFDVFYYIIHTCYG